MFLFLYKYCLTRWRLVNITYYKFQRAIMKQNIEKVLLFYALKINGTLFYHLHCCSLQRIYLIFQPSPPHPPSPCYFCFKPFSKHVYSLHLPNQIFWHRKYLSFFYHFHIKSKVGESLMIKSDREISSLSCMSL